MLEQIEKTIYKVAIYIRLSKEDVDRGYDESESIKNQRTLLTEYVQKLGWKYQLIDTYIDQGFTGTNFNRPDFQRMVRDIENRKIRPNSEEKWIAVENTHEPIIDKKIFDAVQKMLIVQSYNRNEKKNMFLLDGLLLCYECKHKIGVRGKKNGNYYMVCNNYRRNSKLKLCTSHGFSYFNIDKNKCFI